MVKKFRLEEFGYEVELGRLAQQADGAVWIQQGGTVVLATAVSALSKEFPGFFPLTIEYRELYSAAGKIPGGYYKREGKPSDREVLTSRFIDRAMRPLFPADYFNQVQVIATCYSVDKEHSPNVMALIASSLALTISKIPFLQSVGAVELCKIDGNWVPNPSYTIAKAAQARLVVAGTQEGICMVEGSADELSEDEFVEALFIAHEAIKKIARWQDEIRKEFNKPKETIVHSFDWQAWMDKAYAYMTPERVENIYIADKVARSAYLKELQEGFCKEHEVELAQGSISKSVLDFMFDQVIKDTFTELIFVKNQRVDGRAFDQVRQISIDVGLLPRTHGSALFTRGSTQALVSLTLGGGQDEQRMEGIMDDDGSDGRFMLHYNFPPFSVGEVRFMRGPGRREVGHGYLAASALRNMLPSKEDFPYTIRIVADMLESDGSTSMATTCGATMALMQGGVPLKKMVSGVAMGLLKSKAGDFKVLSDISGFEDAFGLMDFKVTGTQEGITAVQMDIKYKGGLSRDIFKAALAQARTSRLHILNEMKKVMDKPSAELSALVPKVVSFTVDSDKVGAIIGTGGKTIREIIEKTKTTIDIDNGLVRIYGTPEADMERAIHWVKTLAGQIEVGTRFVGKIRRIAEFGLFVELVPGVDGLVHVSNIPRHQQQNFATAFKVDDDVTAEIVDYDTTNGRIRLRLIDQK